MTFLKTKGCQSWENGLVYKVLAVEASGPKFGPQYPWTVNLRFWCWEVETGREVEHWVSHELQIQ